MISSSQNPKIKRVRLLQSQSKTRKKEGAFVVEGVRLLEESVKNHQSPELVLFTPDLDSRAKQLLKLFQGQGVLCEEVSREIFKTASDTENPQGILAILQLKPLPFPKPATFFLIADEIRDPGNLGTLLRTSLAAGANGGYSYPGNNRSLLTKGGSSWDGSSFSAPDPNLFLG